MSVKKGVSHIVGLTAEAFARAETPSNWHVPARCATHAEGTRLWSRDYRVALRSTLSRAEVREIISLGKRKAWPRLNEVADGIGSMSEYSERASNLGADFRFIKMPWESGLEVLGFYLGSDTVTIKRPLICLNRAHHPVVVATAFAHEVGHHVTADLFSVPSESVRLARLAGIEAHLSEPRELAADVLVSLRSLPHDVAEKWFDAVSTRKIDSIATILRRVRRIGLHLESLPVRRRHQYQALLIHFVKLRQALLQEYDI